MPHSNPLIATIVLGIVLAFCLGALANRLRVSPLVGYLLAGVLVGPFTPGFVADSSLAGELAEIGVILLMFGVGLHFSLKDLLSVRAIAIPGALAQIAIVTLLGFGLSRFMDWSVAAGIVFGLALSVTSTVVTLRRLQERRLMDSEPGRIAVGWLVVQDLAMVLALVLLPGLSGLLIDGGAGKTGAGIAAAQGLWFALGVTVAKLAAFVLLMLVVGRRVIPWILHYIAYTGSRELFRLAVLAIALGAAYGASELFGVSFALGAFFAGMILSESELSQQAAEETLPLRDAFAVLFFVSVGMLFNPEILLRDPGPVLASFLIIVVGSPAAALLVMFLFRRPLDIALTVAACLAQIGEFSFILASLGVGLGLLPDRGRDLILAGAILSILANPLLFIVLDRLTPWLERHKGRPPAEPEEAALRPGDLPTSTLRDHVVLIGFGRVGSMVGAALERAQRPFLVVEDRRDLAVQLRNRNIEVIFGNSAAPEILNAANLAEARSLVVAIPNGFEAGQIAEQARAANPSIEIIARAHSDAEVEHLQRYGADLIIMGEREIARCMIERILGETAGSKGQSAPAVQAV
ncbi:MAG: monovalent cation:H+ antiporter-2, family [Rhodospirillaceae bacterium]|jgi:CPA2 family monovalent cation:H+ antiporter-2|nr:monovalent cation:H+ antiporter-2, family [Rhodospirillaceae bacterium]